MKYCPTCGKQLADNAFACPGCGQQFSVAGAKTVDSADAPSFGYALLGFFVPIVGLILWLMWKDTTPQRAKSAGKGALVSMILGIVFFIVYIIMIAVLISTGNFNFYTY